MAQAESENLRVDFICLHYYAGLNTGTFDVLTHVAALQTYIQNVYNRFYKPIWLTKCAMINDATTPETYASAAVESQFMTAVVAMLNKLGYVERYSW